MKTAFIRKLRTHARLDDDDVSALEHMPVTVKEIGHHEAIVREGDRPTQCCLIMEGFACRSKTTENGQRQILSIHISGDIPDLQSLHLKTMDHDLTTLSNCRAGFISHETIRSLTRQRPNIADALWRETLVDAAVFREWIVNVGRRSASQRMAHLVMELRERLKVVGLSTDARFELPMSQHDIADALGLTPVHVNRVIMALRRDGVLEFRRHVVALGDAERLIELGEFDDLYLHQDPVS